jgi:hypothetical protein
MKSSFLILINIGFLLAFENEVNYDTEDIIFQIKGFFDQYVEGIKNKLKSVDKILYNNSTDYIEDFNLNDLLSSTKNFEDDLKNMLTTDLKDFRAVKQTLDEKSIDFETKIKILKHRFTRTQTELSKLTNEVNGRNNTKQIISNEIKSNLNEMQLQLFKSVELVRSLLNDLNKYEKSIYLVKLDLRSFNYTYINNDKQDTLNSLKLKLHETNTEVAILTKTIQDKITFMNNTYHLEKLFVKNAMFDIKIVEDSIKNKTESLKRLKANVDEKRLSFDNLNMTIRKLKSVQEEYKGRLWFKFRCLA